MANSLENVHHGEGGRSARKGARSRDERAECPRSSRAAHAALRCSAVLRCLRHHGWEDSQGHHIWNWVGRLNIAAKSCDLVSARLIVIDHVKKYPHEFHGCRRNTYYLNMSIFGGLVVAQVLLWLFGIWMINVKCLVEYQSCPSPYRATHCKVRSALGSLAVLVLANLSFISGSHLWFQYGSLVLASGGSSRFHRQEGDCPAGSKEGGGWSARNQLRIQEAAIPL